MTELSHFYSSVKKYFRQRLTRHLEQHVEKLETQALQKLEELEKKLLRAEKEKS